MLKAAMVAVALLMGRVVAAPAPLVSAVASGGAGFHARAPAYATASPALAIYVHADNPLSRATLTQLDAIFSTTRRRGYPVDITTWGQLGLTGEWADKAI